MKRKGTSKPEPKTKKKTINQEVVSDYEPVLEELLRQTQIVQHELPEYANYFSNDNITKIPREDCDFIFGICGLIEILSDNLSLLLQNRDFAEDYEIIGQWKTNPEYPETWELKMLDYSTLPLILKKSTFITKEFLENLIQYTRKNDTRRKVCESAIASSIQGIPELYDALEKMRNDSYTARNLLNMIRGNETEHVFKSARNQLIPRLPYLNEKLPGFTIFSDNFLNRYLKFGIPIYSGIGFNILSNTEMTEFCNQGQEIELSFRSFTIDLRVAIHFSGRIQDTEDGSLVHDPYNKVIFMTFLNDDDTIPFVSNKFNTWESEVLINIATYKYITHHIIIINGIRYTIILVKITVESTRPTFEDNYSSELSEELCSRTIEHNDISARVSSQQTDYYGSQPEDPSWLEGNLGGRKKRRTVKTKNITRKRITKKKRNNKKNKQ